MNAANQRRWLLGLLVPAVAVAPLLGGTASAATGACPAWVRQPVTPPAQTTTTPATTTPTTTAPVASTMARATSLPAIAYVAGSTMVGARTAVLIGSVRGAAPVAVTAEYWQSASSTSCTPVQHPSSIRTQFSLSGLQPGKRYRFRLVVNDATGASTSAAGTFVTLPSGVIAEGVTIGDTPVGRLSRAAALTKLNHLDGAPLRFTYAGGYWRVLPSQVGARIRVADAVTAALEAAPGQQLAPPAITVDKTRLRTYVTSLGKRWSRKPSQPSVRLVGTHAVITQVQPGVTVNTALMTQTIGKELTTGKRTLVQLTVRKARASAAPPQKAVVVRLGSQTLTAYLNGKPILKTPVTTGRPALPTPIGSFKVQFRASPYTFYSPWPKGSPYYYPPAPVTWAMEFYDGDFLHNDPAEPSDAFGSDSQDGYFASHGCVHIPDGAMSFLYGWLPVGAPVIVSQN